MTKRGNPAHHGHLFEDLLGRERSQPTEPRIHAVEHLRRSVDAELLRDVIGDQDYE